MVDAWMMANETNNTKKFNSHALDENIVTIL